MTLPPAAVAPTRCADLRPWTKRCEGCGLELSLLMFPLLSNPNYRKCFGGSGRVCSGCDSEMRSAAYWRSREAA